MPLLIPTAEHSITCRQPSVKNTNPRRIPRRITTTITEIPKMVMVVVEIEAEAEAAGMAKVLALPRTGALHLLRQLLPTKLDPRKKSLASLRLSNKDLVRQVRIANIATITRS